MPNTFADKSKLQILFFFLQTPHYYLSVDQTISSSILTDVVDL